MLEIESVSMPTTVRTGEKFTISVKLMRLQPHKGLYPHKKLYPVANPYRLSPEKGLYPHKGLHPSNGDVH